MPLLLVMLQVQVGLLLLVMRQVQHMLQLQVMPLLLLGVLQPLGILQRLGIKLRLGVKLRQELSNSIQTIFQHHSQKEQNFLWQETSEGGRYRL